MTVILWISSGLLYWGERQVRARRFGRARIALGLAIVLGIAFAIVEVFECLNHLKTLTPQTDAYGSIFNTITSFHAAHVILGLVMLAYAFVLPAYESIDRPRRPYHNAALYWHFVGFVWFWILLFLYVPPNIR